MKKGLVALAMGAFALGFGEFVVIGVLSQVAATLGVTIPEAGNFVSAYAVGVCFGTLFLVLGHKVAPKKLLVFFMALCCAGNIFAALAPSAFTMLVARFISGLPHGAFFGTATIAARAMAEKGKEGKAVAGMVLGQSLANTIGVPGGTLLSGIMSWRAAFALVGAWGLAAAIMIFLMVPHIDPVPDAGLAGQFTFLKKPGPWVVLAAVLLGNTGVFCWWSYVSPWLVSTGGFEQAVTPLLLVLAGLGMTIGSQVGGRLGDKVSPGWASCVGQSISAVMLLLIFAFSPVSPVLTVILMVCCCVGFFFVSSPQQVVMVEIGQGGGEMIGSACVQIAFNGGNAVGAFIGQRVLDAGCAYNVTALAGAPIAACAAALLALYALRFEREYHTA